MGYARFDDMRDVGRKISSFDDWKTEFSKIADVAELEKRFLNAAFYRRAAELFTTRKDPDKEALYTRFIEGFYDVFRDDGIERFEVPYGNTFLAALRIRPTGSETKGTVVVHGGFDSFIEELYSMLRYFADNGYEVVAFDGPGQGATRKKYGVGFDHKWEQPTKAVLDYFKLDDVTLIGVSMGGWLCLRAAAFEPRISRVIASSVSFDVSQYTNIAGQKIAKLFFTVFRKFTNNAILKKMRKDMQYSWFVNNLMYITKTDVPIEGFDALLRLNEDNLNSDLIVQDVLILTGRKDHLVPFKMHKLQVEALTNAKSVTAKVFTEKENAHNHCQVGNLELSFQTMVNWIDEK